MVFPDYALDGQDSPSDYRHYESGRGPNDAADRDLQATLDSYLDPATRQWAEPVLHDLGEGAGATDHAAALELLGP